MNKKNEPIIPLMRSSMPSLEDFIDEIKPMWHNRRLTNMGSLHEEFNHKLLDYLEVPHVTLFANGHLALESALEAFNLSGEVITTPFTFASTTHAIIRKGLTPVFCDVRLEDGTLDPELIEPFITEKTCAILPVHIYGQPCQVNQIEKIGKKHDLPVIYDAAHAFGVYNHDRGIGSFGDASIFSFHASKLFHTIEGGAVTFKDNSLLDKLDDLKNFGIRGPEHIARVGGNAKFNEFQAAMGLCNLKHINHHIKHRKTLVHRYYINLSGIKGIRLLPQLDAIRYNYSYMPVFFDGFKIERNEMQNRLNSYGIETRKYFYPLTSQFPCFKGHYDHFQTPIADKLSQTVLTLPLFDDLTVEEVDFICHMILN